MSRRGHLVTLEGGDGAGKSTQLAALAERARATGVEVVTCREPGGTALGERLREALLGGEEPSPTAELLVYVAARAQLVAEVIRPAIERGGLVLCDRFADSTLAYQCFGRGLPRADVEAANAIATGGLRPDRTLLLDVDPSVGLGRGAEGRGEDYLERAGDEFHARVREGYLVLAAEEPGRWVVLDGSLPAEVVTEAAWAAIEGLLEEGSQ